MLYRDWMLGIDIPELAHGITVQFTGELREWSEDTNTIAVLSDTGTMYHLQIHDTPINVTALKEIYIDALNELEQANCLVVAVLYGGEWWLQTLRVHLIDNYCEAWVNGEL